MVGFGVPVSLIEAFSVDMVVLILFSVGVVSCLEVIVVCSIFLV